MVILSYHPLYTADINRLCAGREPGEADRAVIRRAEAVLLPQGCRESLYRLARDNCAHVFPNYDARFDYPGKLAQIHLFRRLRIHHPPSRLFESLGHFERRYDSHAIDAISFPKVLKFDWGGDGKTVHFVASRSSFERLIQTIARYESSGQYGFMLQDYIASKGRSLRVVVVHEAFFSYWRIHRHKDAFLANLAQGADIDGQYAPALQRAAVGVTRTICQKTGINLAGFDFIFAGRDLKTGKNAPLLLEINYFFGRRGLGGSRHYYRLLQQQISRWLEHIKHGLDRRS